MDLVAVRKGLANRIKTLPNDIHVSYVVPDQIQMLTAVVRPDSQYVSYQSPFAGERIDHANFEVLFVVGKNVDFDWQEKLDRLCSTGTQGSAVDAIEGDQTLNGLVSTLRVTSAEGWGTGDVNGVDCGTFLFKVTVWV